jgi:hypothetical protein
MSSLANIRPRVLRPAVTLLALTAMAGLAACNSSSAQVDDQGRPVLTEDAMAKATRDLQAAIAKDRASGGRMTGGAAGAGPDGLAVPAGGGTAPLAARGPDGAPASQLAPTPGVPPVIIRDPSPATSPTAILTGAKPAGSATVNAGGVAATAPGPSPAPAPAPAPSTAAANAPLELDRPRPPASSSARGQTSADVAAQRENRLSSHLREIAQILDTDITAGKSSTYEPGTAEADRKLLSSSMVLASLSPLDKSIADRYSSMRSRLTDDQRNVTDVVRQLSETAVGRSIRPDGTVRVLETDKPSTVTQAETTVSVLSRVLTDGAAKVTEATGLTIPTVALVSSVESYGRYTPMPSNRFIAGRGTPVLVYNELANFSNTAIDDNNRSEGEFGVSIQQRIELRPVDGQVVAVDFGPQEFISRARSSRRDLFLARRIDLPPNLTIGKYVLNVNIKDLATGHSEEAKIQLEVVAK